GHMAVARSCPAAHCHRIRSHSCYEPPMRAPPTHSKVIGYIFWFFGFTGAHRFYYGRPVTGVIWLLTLGLLGIGWIIDAFLIPGMDDAANRKIAVKKKQRHTISGLNHGHNPGLF
ncbi:MAG: TM2 domain-containing protein, partial [Chrysiogenales bacterium]